MTKAVITNEQLQEEVAKLRNQVDKLAAQLQEVKLDNNSSKTDMIGVCELTKYLKVSNSFHACECSKSRKSEWVLIKDSRITSGDCKYGIFICLNCLVVKESNPP